jgi:uncharacterized protein YceH (UPF0502 family)
MSEATPTPVAWPPLDPLARRVLGVLIEKAKTTPDNYPLSLNALVAGCNQKNNRDPVMNLIDAEVEEAMSRLKQLGYAEQIFGSGRVDKFRHVLYHAWRVGKEELAILGELLLRGPQTEGELRGRASRMEPLPDLETLRSHLQHLASRGLVVYLGPEGRRGTLITHGFHLPEEQAHLTQGVPTAVPAPPKPAPAPAVTDLAERINQLEAEVRDLRATLARLADQLERLSS